MVKIEPSVSALRNTKSKPGVLKAVPPFSEQYVFLAVVLTGAISTDRLISPSQWFWWVRVWAWIESTARAAVALLLSDTQTAEFEQVGVSLGFGSGCRLSRHKLRWMNMSVCSEACLFHNPLWGACVEGLLRMTPLLQVSTSSFFFFISFLFVFWGVFCLFC